VRTLVIGTAGHIDHGKSTLVKALTGTDPDRLKEEQARGITIDLGFAHVDLGDASVAFVDVPGHERFVRNMLAGAGGIDAVLLVVAADESVMPQTREHFHICRLLGLERGLVAITKADLVDRDTLGLVELEIRDLVAGSFLEGAPMLPVSARTGVGLDALRDELTRAAGAPARVDREGVVRLAIDRVFSVRGFGAVVTGTLVSGRLEVGAELLVLPDERRVRVRGLQVHGRSQEFVVAPSRAAVNIGTVDVEELSRGMTLASAGTLPVTRRVDVKISLIDGTHALRHGARVRVHHGTREVLGRVSIGAVRSGVEEEWQPARPGEAGVSVPGGGDAFARLRVDRPVVVTRGDRLVLRAASPLATIGGAVVLDPEPPAGGLRRQSALDRFLGIDDERRVVAIWLAEAAGRGLVPDDLVRRAGLGRTRADRTLVALERDGLACRGGDRFFDAAWIARIEAGVSRALAAFHQAAPLEPGLSREALRDQVARGASPAAWDLAIARLLSAGVIRGTDRLALASHTATPGENDERDGRAVEAQVAAAGLQLLDMTTLVQKTGLAAPVVDRIVRGLARTGVLVRLGPLVGHRDALTQLKDDVRRVKEEGGAGPATIDVAAFKGRYGLSRKYAIPLLEWLDRERVTRRTGDVRVVL
jgi:selenocysteine-specific elongation factor